MNCNRHKLSLYSYLKGNSKSFENNSISQHLDQCSDCRKELWEINTLKEVLQQSYYADPPVIDLKSGIMGAINLNRYKDAQKKRMRNLATLGLSLVAAGLLLIIINLSTLQNGNIIIHSRTTNTMEAIKQKVIQPIEFISKGITGMSSKIINLDGISLRIEKEIRGGN